MKPKGLLIAVVLLAVLGGIVWWSNRQKAAEGKAGETANRLLTIPEDQIQEIHIKKLTGEAQTLRRENDQWLMTQPKQLPADRDTVASMVSALSSLNWDKVVEEKATDLKPFGLNTPTLDIEVRRKDGKTDRLLMGDDLPTGGGAYAKLAGDARVVAVSSFVKSSLDKRPEDLRDKRLLTFDSEKLTRVELQAKGQTIEFGKSGQNEWQIIRPRPLRADSIQVENLVTKLKDAKMDVLAPEDTAKAFAGAARVAVATVTDPAGNQSIEIRKDKDNNVYVKSTAVEGFFKTASDLAEAVDKGLDAFRNRKLFEFGFSDPSRLQLRGVTYTKSGDKWTSNGKTMDNASVQLVIDKLRDLSAVSFAETAGGEVALEAVVTSNEGKRVERATIRKERDKYLAQRENDPSIYVIESSAFTDLNNAVGAIKEAAPPPAPDKKKK